jgi:hypothetical protein
VGDRGGDLDGEEHGEADQEAKHALKESMAAQPRFHRPETTRLTVIVAPQKNVLASGPVSSRIVPGSSPDRTTMGNNAIVESMLL